jgi:hypothetical protein
MVTPLVLRDDGPDPRMSAIILGIRRYEYEARYWKRVANAYQSVLLKQMEGSKDGDGNDGTGQTGG